MKTNGNEKRMSLVCRILVLFLIALLIGLNIYGLNARNVVREPMPMPFGIGCAVVLSGSMSPTLEVDDLVIVRECDSYAPGDIVVFRSGKSLVIHRIIAVAEKEGLVFTKGDNKGNSPDAPIRLGDIKGKMICRVPKLGGVMDILRSPAALLLLVMAAVLLMIRSFRRDAGEITAEQEALRAEIERLKAETGKDENENE